MLAGLGLGGQVEIGVEHDADDRVATRDRVVGEEERGLARGRHLESAGDHALAGELTLPGSFEPGAGESHAHAVALRGHRVGAAEQGRERGVGEPVLARADDDPQQDLTGGRHGHGRDVQARLLDRCLTDGDPVSDPGYRRPQAGEGVGGPGPEHRSHVDAPADPHVGPEPGGRRAQSERAPIGQPEHRRPADGAVVDGHRAVRTGHRDEHPATRTHRQAAEGHLEHRRTLGVAQEPVRQPVRASVSRPRRPDAQSREAVATTVLDRRQRTGGQHLEGAARPLRRHDASTNRTRRPGTSRAGGSRSMSHISREVRPMSCHPPGEDLG